MDIRVRKAKQADAETLLDIKREGSMVLLARLGHAVEEIAAWQSRFVTIEYMRQHLRAPHALYLVEEGGEPVGMAGITYFVGGGVANAEFNNLYVLQSGKGAGTALMKHRLQVADALNLEYVESRVHEKNLRAKSFVGHFSFTQSATAKSPQHGGGLVIFRRFPESQLAPRGKCQCGCGAETKISEYTKPEWGRVRGEPCLYAKGHQSRMRRKANLTISGGELVAEMPLTGSDRPIVVDVDDACLIFPWTWRADKRENTVYAAATDTTQGKKTTVYAHRVIMKESLLGDQPYVDHKDRDGLNNRRENLRPATNRQNSFNRVSHGVTSQYKGVSQRSETKWTAMISLGGENRYLGTFSKEEDAAREYDRAAKEHHGEFYVPNLPEEQA